MTTKRQTALSTIRSELKELVQFEKHLRNRKRKCAEDKEALSSITARISECKRMLADSKQELGQMPTPTQIATEIACDIPFSFVTKMLASDDPKLADLKAEWNRLKRDKASLDLHNSTTRDQHFERFRKDLAKEPDEIDDDEVCFYYLYWHPQYRDDLWKLYGRYTRIMNHAVYAKAREQIADMERPAKAGHKMFDAQAQRRNVWSLQCRKEWATWQEWIDEQSRDHKWSFAYAQRQAKDEFKVSLKSIKRRTKKAGQAD